MTSIHGIRIPGLSSSTLIKTSSDAIFQILAWQEHQSGYHQEKQSPLWSSGCRSRLVTTTTRPKLSLRPIKIPAAHTWHTDRQAGRQAGGQAGRAARRRPIFVGGGLSRTTRRHGAGGEALETRARLCRVSGEPWPYFKVPLGPAESWTGAQFHGDAPLPVIISAYPCSPR